MKHLFWLSIMAIYCHDAFCQYQANNWVIGDSAGLNFNSGIPISIESNIFSWEASASISDNDGNLLFYTNGQKVWNKLHEVMPNGDSLNIGVLTSRGSSMTQGVIILPDPSDKMLYYIFHLQQNDDESLFGLDYSKVNMSLNEGSGDVTEKNIQIYFEPVFEKMYAVKHANGRDWWLIICKYPSVMGKDNQSTFIKFLITPYGISEPDEQIFGPDYVPLEDGNSYLGQMKFSHHGDKLAVTRGKHADIYDFDRCTGELSNWIELLDIDEEGVYGCEFSPDDSKLYITNVGNDYKSKLYQLCLDCGSDIISTKKIIYKINEDYYWVFQLQLAPDDKIYVNNYAYDLYPGYMEVNQSLSVINNPNEEGVACNFDTLTVYLGGHTQTLSLPNMPNYNLGALAGSPCDTLGVEINNLENKHEINIYPNPTSNFITVSGLHSDIEYSLEIFNVLGERMYAINKLAGLSTLDISDLHHGLYEVVIKSNGIILLNEKLIILQ